MEYVDVRILVQPQGIAPTPRWGGFGLHSEGKTMKPVLAPSSDQVETFRMMTEFGKDLLKLSESIDDFEFPPLTPKIAEDHLAAKLAETEIDKETLLIQVAGLHRVMEQADSNEEDIVDSLSAALDVANWKDGEKQNWNEFVAPAIEKLLTSEFFRIFSKSSRLSYDYAMLAADLRVITDVRPIFSKDVDSISGMIVSFVLRIDHQNADQPHTLSVALDLNDVIGLYNECERAIRKAETLVKCMDKGGAVYTAIAGEQ